MDSVMFKNRSHSIKFEDLTPEQVKRIIKSLRYEARVNLSNGRPTTAYMCEQFACNIAVNSK